MSIRSMTNRVEGFGWLVFWGMVLDGFGCFRSPLDAL